MKKFILFAVLIILLVSLVNAFLIDEPMEISLKSKTCLGGSYCLVGEEISLNLKFNQGAKLSRPELVTKLTSDTLNIEENILINSTESDIDIPLNIPLSLTEGEYSISLDTSAISYLNFFDKILLGIKHLFVSESREEIDIRYPKLVLSPAGYSCKKNNGEYYFETITLTYKDSLPYEISCKIRIYVDEDTKTPYSSLSFGESNSEFDFYDTEYKSLNNENGLTIQKVSFKTAVDTQTTNTYLISVCNIDGNEVEIPNSKNFGDCKVK